MSSINDQLANLFVQHQHYLLRVEAGAVRSMEAPFRQALSEVEERLAKSAAKGTLSTYSVDRLGRLQGELAALMQAAAADSGRGLVTLLEQTIQAENEAATGILKDTLPFPVDTLVNFERVPLDVVQSMIQEPLGRGKPLDGILKTLEDNAAGRVKQSLATSIILGEGAEAAARRIRDLTTGKTMPEARRIARTEIHHAAISAQNKMYDANRDVLKGLQWMATFDQRTCPECAQLDGMQWYYSGDPTIDGAPEPPLHPLCRCVRVGVTRSWSELGFTKDDLKGFPGLADLDGEAARLPAYGEWFNRQPKEVQLAILGPKKWGAWDSGKLKFNTGPQAMGATPRALAPSTLSALRGLGKDAAPKKSLGPVPVREDVKAATLRRSFSAAAERAGVPRAVLAGYYRDVRAGGRADLSMHMRAAIADGMWVLPPGTRPADAVNAALRGVTADYAQQIRTAMAYSKSARFTSASAFDAAAGRAIPAFMDRRATLELVKQTMPRMSAGGAERFTDNLLKGARFMATPGGRAAGSEFIVQTLAAQGHPVVSTGIFETGKVRAFTIPAVENTAFLSGVKESVPLRAISSGDKLAILEAQRGATVAMNIRTITQLGAMDAAELDLDIRGLRSVFHEYGHALEMANPEVQKAATKFVASRTKDEQAQSMRALTGIQGYGTGEIAKPDQFYNPYTGRVYEDGATEAVSMATEHIPAFMLADTSGTMLHSETVDAVRWATYDPGHAAFLLNVIRATPPL